MYENHSGVFWRSSTFAVEIITVLVYAQFFCDTLHHSFSIFFDASFILHNLSDNSSLINTTGPQTFFSSQFVYFFK